MQLLLFIESVVPQVVIDDNHRSRQNAEDINVVTSLVIQVELIFLTLSFSCARFSVIKKQQVFKNVVFVTFYCIVVLGQIREFP